MVDEIDIFGELLPNDRNTWLSKSGKSVRSPISPSSPLLIERELQSLSEDRLQSLLHNPTLFSIYERNYCQNKPTPLLSIAGLWCAKVAFTKLTTKRLRFLNFTFLDLEIRHHPSGQPTVILHNSLAKWYRRQNLAVEVAIAHQNTLAVAMVICFSHTG